MVIAVAGSALAGVVVGVFRTRHERNESFKDRMLTAADDLATGLAQALLAVRQRLDEIEDWVVEHRDVELQSDLREARRLIDEAAARLARCELLFGVESPPTTAAAACLTSLRQAVWTLEGGGDIHPVWDRAGEQFRAAQEAYRDFATSARQAVSDYGRFRR